MSKILLEFMHLVSDVIAPSTLETVSLHKNTDSNGFHPCTIIALSVTYPPHKCGKNN